MSAPCVEFIFVVDPDPEGAVRWFLLNTNVWAHYKQYKQKMCVYRITAKETAQTHTTRHLSSVILLYLSAVCVAMFVCVSLFCP